MNSYQNTICDSHSTMYLLKHRGYSLQACDEIHSHSTMYLLKLKDSQPKQVTKIHSHSTMYLLKLYHMILHI